MEEQNSASSYKDGEDSDETADEDVASCHNTSNQSGKGCIIRRNRNGTDDKSVRNKHVCTFCLMMTKVTPSITSRKR